MFVAVSQRSLQALLAASHLAHACTLAATAVVAATCDDPESQCVTAFVVIFVTHFKCCCCLLEAADVQYHSHLKTVFSFYF